MDAGPNFKRMNTHLHLMEAFTSYYSLTQDELAGKRLFELVLVLSNAVLRKSSGMCTDMHQVNWAPLNGRRLNQVSYGHALENIWLLIEACYVLKIHHGPFHDLFRTLFDNASQYGFDKKRGGFYYMGPMNAPAKRREKSFWVQAEALVCALQMYCLTHSERYVVCFRKVLDWIVNNQVDWRNGEWHATIDERGRCSGNKAGMWKAPYHSGRAMIKCLDLLAVLQKESSTNPAGPEPLREETSRQDSV